MAARISVSRARSGLGHPEARALVLRAVRAALKDHVFPAASFML